MQHHPWGGGYALPPAGEGAYHGRFPKAAIDAAHGAVVLSGPLSQGCSASGCLLKGTWAPDGQSGPMQGGWGFGRALERGAAGERGR